ncbi:MAG: hypothetical protein HKL82_12230 [Acidimicrobiaceae bacterium]|nr:hypothetical protein [Acidimicrobiaceae bacterium]
MSASDEFSGTNLDTIDSVVFDIGGVLINVDFHHLYRQLIDDEAERERVEDSSAPARRWTQMEGRRSRPCSKGHLT